MIGPGGAIFGMARCLRSRASQDHRAAARPRTRDGRSMVEAWSPHPVIARDRGGAYALAAQRARPTRPGRRSLASHGERQRGLSRRSPQVHAPNPGGHRRERRSIRVADRRRAAPVRRLSAPRGDQRFDHRTWRTAARRSRRSAAGPDSAEAHSQAVLAGQRSISFRVPSKLAEAYAAVARRISGRLGSAEWRRTLATT